MINKQTIEVTTVNRFSMRERMKIVLGHQVMNKSYIEITGRYIQKQKEVEITQETKQIQTFLGRPKKQEAPALPKKAPEGSQQSAKTEGVQQ